jgi:hypothetical protein
VRTALVDRDEALRRARQDLAGAHAMAAEWEAEVVSARAQLQRDRATLKEARAWQSQAEERAKEAEELRASLVLGKLVFGSITLVRPHRPPSACARFRPRGEAFAVRMLTKR